MQPRRAAAVALAIFAEPPHGVVFIERAAHLRHHAGQIGLPGGVADPEDGGDLQRTALREMREEVGVEPERVLFVWTLRDLRPNVSNFHITPYVAIVEPGPLVVDPRETAAVFCVPLSVVVNEVRDGAIRLGALDIQTTLLDYDGRRIWGLTGSILRDFVDSWNEPGSAMRKIIEERLR